MNQMFKVILVDIGNVLSLSSSPYKKHKGKHIFKNVHLEISKRLGISLNSWVKIFYPILEKSIVGHITKSQTISFLSKELNLKKDYVKKTIISAYTKHFFFNYELINKFLALKKLGYKIMILSDQWHLSKEALFSQKVFKDFDLSFISCDIGYRKPSKEIFKLILDTLKIDSSKILFIDDLQLNLNSAKSFGIKTLLFKNNKQLFKHPRWKALFKNGQK